MAPPVRPEPYSRTDWLDIARNAAVVRKEDPDYAEARQVFAHAIREAQRLTQQENAAEMREAQRLPGGAATAALQGFSQGATFGFGDEIAAGLALLPGGDSPREALERSRGVQEAAIEQHPIATIAGEVVGAGAVPIGGGYRGATRLAQAGVPAVLRTAAFEAGTGAATGALYGTGKAEGGLGERLDAAGTNALIGAALGGTVGGVTGKVAERNLIRRARLARAAERVSPPAVQATPALPPARPPLTLEPPTFVRRNTLERSPAGSGTPYRVPASAPRFQPGGDFAPGSLQSPTTPPTNPAADAARKALEKLNVPPEKIEATIAKNFPAEGAARVEVAPPRRPVDVTLTEPSSNVTIPAFTPPEQAANRALVEEQVKSGVRGPRGGARVGRAKGKQARDLARLAVRIRDMSTEQLQREMGNPLVDSWIKEAAEKELQRRATALRTGVGEALQ